jgi:tetratricopeptide (TPR) repeat protein
LAWGQSLLRKGHKDEGVVHLSKARGLTAPGDGDLRVDVVVAQAQAYGGKNAAEQATRLVKGELAASKTTEQKARLVSALVATSADWGTRLAKNGDLDGAIQYYVQALKQLGKAQPQERYAMAMRLDPLYAAKGNYSARLQLAAQLADDPAFEAMRGDLAVYRSEVLKGWARFHEQKGNYKSAVEKYGAALAVLPRKEWKRRYDVAAAVGQIASAKKDYPEIVSTYDKVLPDIADPALLAQVRQYVGRVDMEWAGQARAQKNPRMARIRYLHALELLPVDPPAERLAALHGLSQVLVESKKPDEAVKTLAAESKKFPHRAAQQSAELLVGAVYRDSLHDPQQARAWFTKADAGDAAPASLEAGMALADLDEKGGHAQAAAQRLETMAKRDLGESPWFVPVHYKLAVLYHGQQKLPEALDEYTKVSKAESREARTSYAKVIAESREQARAIAEYLKITGGAAGSRVAVPKLGESR